MSTLIADLTHDFRKHKDMADKAMSALSDDDFFQRPGEAVNPIALIVKHLAGNFRSRWTDFLTTDGDKPTRDRDGEFTVTPADTRGALLAAWEHAWATLFGTLAGLIDADLTTIIPIRGEAHTVQQALLRGLSHTAYHVGQITYVARLLKPDAPYLTIPPGRSQGHKPGYLKPPTS